MRPNEHRMPRQCSRGRFRSFSAIIRRLFMSSISSTILRAVSLLVLIFALNTAYAQSGNAGAVRGTVADPSGAVISGASVNLVNAASGLSRVVVSDAQGQFEFSNVPFNLYRISVSANGFAPVSRSFEIRS